MVKRTLWLAHLVPDFPVLSPEAQHDQQGAFHTQVHEVYSYSFWASVEAAVEDDGAQQDVLRSRGRARQRAQDTAAKAGRNGEADERTDGRTDGRTHGGRTHP